MTTVASALPRSTPGSHVPWQARQPAVAHSPSQGRMRWGDQGEPGGQVVIRAGADGVWGDGGRQACVCVEGGGVKLCLSAAFCVCEVSAWAIPDPVGQPSPCRPLVHSPMVAPPPPHTHTHTLSHLVACRWGILNPHPYVASESCAGGHPPLPPLPPGCVQVGYPEPAPLHGLRVLCGWPVSRHLYTIMR